jgi:hypothetical protein
MKKQVIKMFSMLSLAVTLAVVAVYANPVSLAGQLKANIPFGFTVGDKTLPTGVYTVAPMSTPGVLQIRSVDGRAGVLIQTNGLRTRQVQDQTKLVFRRYGNHYFLAQIWTAGDTDGREILKSRAERQLIKGEWKRLAQNAGEPEIVCIVAN